MNLAIGIDIGGTGIKGGIANLDTGELVSDRVKIPTPTGGSPSDIVRTVVDIIAELGEEHATNLPLGVCFPAVVLGGVTMSAANVSTEWIGLDAEELFERHLGRSIHFVNDADAAGIAEVRYGAATGQSGLVVMTTLGTGIGSAMIHNGVLIPNSELGHLEVDGSVAEHRAANSARERENLSWEEWSIRLQRYYSHLEMLFSPELFIVGGGVSKSQEHFLPRLSLRTPIVPAVLRNNAGILGAASLAS